MKDKKLALRDTQRVFDTLLTLQSKADNDSPFGGSSDYEDDFEVWAESRFLRGRNFYSARAANIKTDVEFIIRNRNDIDENMRIKANNKYYNIEGILPLDNDRLFLTIRANEIKHDL